MIKKLFLFIVLSLLLLESYQVFTEETTITSALAQILFSNNLHEVRANELYRSGEIVPGELAKIVKEKGIKTVLDVRADPKNLSRKYTGEEQAVTEVGATYLSFPMLGSKEMSKESILELLDLVQKIEPPLLVHCTSGTHRSGVVAVIWLMQRDGVSFDEAMKQLSAKYGYFYFERKLKSVIQGHPTIDNVLWRYGEALKKEKIPFKEWVERDMK